MYNYCKQLKKYTLFVDYSNKMCQIFLGLFKKSCFLSPGSFTWFTLFIDNSLVNGKPKV